MNEKKKILFIDGEQKLHEKMQEILSDNLPDASMIYAADSSKGTNMANELNPDLVISAFEGKKGIEICKALKSKRKTSEIPFILFTADSARHKEEAIYKGADSCIEKAFRKKEIKCLIQSIDVLTGDKWRKYGALYCLDTVRGCFLIGEYAQHQNTALDIISTDSKVISMKTVSKVDSAIVDELNMVCRKMEEIMQQYAGKIIDAKCYELKIPSCYNCIVPNGKLPERIPTAEFLEKIITKEKIHLPGYKPKSWHFLENYRLN